MTPPEQYACLYAEEFPAQALLRLHPELHAKPCVVMEGDPSLEQVCSLNTRARQLGLRPGMTRVEVELFPATLGPDCQTYRGEQLAQYRLDSCHLSPKMACPSSQNPELPPTEMQIVHSPTDLNENSIIPRSLAKPPDTRARSVC